MFEAGTILADKYRIDRLIGRGGMGVVVAATHLQLHHAVALKFLLPDFVQNAQVVERFVREARASVQLRSEHVCRVSDVGVLDTGSPYIVMELLEGRDLASLGRQPLPLACEYVLQACAGLAEAHALGIVHRDLKPANLFLTARADGLPLVKVLDFGIAKSHGAQDFALTQTSMILGSPGYMSPEQLKSSRDVDARSDIWSLGVILYQLVSGRQPFTGESLTELALHIAMDPLPPLGVGGAFEAVVSRALAKDPAQRYADVAQLAHALAPFAGPQGAAHAQRVARLLRGHTAPGMESSPLVYATPTTIGGATGSRSVPAPRGKRWGWIAAGALGAAAIATVVVLAVGGHREEPPAPPPKAAVSPPPAIDAAPPPPAIDAAPPPAIDAAAAPAIDAPAKTAHPPHPPHPQNPTRPEDFGDRL